MLNDLLKKLEHECMEYGYIYNPPATEKEIQYLKQNVKNMFGADLPDQFIDLLLKTNGVGYDGLTIYAVDVSLLETKPDNPANGFIETNEIWYEVEDQKKYLFFGDDDISWYALNLAEGAYHVLDKPSGTVMETFDDFDSMLESALRAKLD
jgi:hypothetical protein